MKIHRGVLEISRKRGKNSIFIRSSLTFDPWRWADLAQNLISSSTPGGAGLYQVWWKSTQGFLRFRINLWPLTLGGSHPKSNQLIVTSNLTFWPSLMKFHQVILELSRKQKNPDGHPDGRTDGQPGNIMPPAPLVRRHKNNSPHLHTYTYKLQETKQIQVIYNI